MLNKYGKFRYAICTFQGETSHQQHQNRNIGSQIFKYSKRSTQIQTNQNRKPNPTAGTHTKCNTFQGLSVFSVFQNFIKYSKFLSNSCQTSLTTGLVNTLEDQCSTSRGIDPVVSKYKITNVKQIWKIQVCYI